MKIYTKTGDKGISSLYDGTRKSKSDLRFICIGEIDELNSLLGVIVSIINKQPELNEKITSVQSDLFCIGAILATPDVTKLKDTMMMSEKSVTNLEKDIDEWDKEIETLKNFILPGGVTSAAMTHYARTVCRRAERSVVTLAKDENVDKVVIAYLNRLSDWLFTLARFLNKKTKTPETIWSKKN